MPIKGLTRPDDFDTKDAMPLIAKLRLGSPRQQVYSQKLKKEVMTSGREIDYFRVDFQPHFEFLREAWERKYGQEPRVFHNVIMLGDRADDIIPNWHEKWHYNKLQIRCDGEHQVLHWDEKLSKRSEDLIPCHGGEKQGYSCVAECRRVARFEFGLEDFTRLTGIVGKFMIETSSRDNIATIWNQLKAMEARLPTLFGLRGTLGRSEKLQNYVADGAEKTRKGHPIYLYFDTSVLQHQLANTSHSQSLALPDVSNELLLDAPTFDDIVLPEEATGDYLDPLDVEKMVEVLQNKGEMADLSIGDVMSFLDELSVEPEEVLASEKPYIISQVIGKWFLAPVPDTDEVIYLKDNALQVPTRIWNGETLEQISEYLSNYEVDDLL